ncbi:hypothetical protein, variant [Verruconis gallopava]|uniref:Uncharacterized protein n=1 Tax=Verruconis gallopava TaxID=253628 RepID=A0A0D1XLH2_9PEZI|nr:hypothetical protein, variant [Verruconis gallopava]KIW03276.1 hypothetical protein, variant [Verruconis gallopava]
MLFTRLILLGCAAIAAAKGNSTAEHHMDGARNGTHMANTERRQCAEIAEITAIVNLVNNATELAKFETRHNLSQSDIAEIKSKAATDEAKLKALQSNSTLMQECAVMAAGMKLRAQCREIKELTMLSDLANNQTALQEFQTKHNLTAAEMTKFTDRAKNATEKLATLQKNTTLVAACKSTNQSQSSKFS